MSLVVSPPLANSVFVARDFADVRSEAKKIGWDLPSELSSAHTSRQDEWLASRLCLSDAFEKLGVSVSPLSLRFINHQELESFADYRFSFSHTKNLAACFLVHDTSRTTRLGLDIEVTSRVISDAVDKRLNIGRRSSGDSPLARWCVREAIFKSLNEKQQDAFLTDRVEVNENCDFLLRNSKARGYFKLFENQDFIAALAWSTLVSS